MQVLTPLTLHLIVLLTVLLTVSYFFDLPMGPGNGIMIAQ